MKKVRRTPGPWEVENLAIHSSKGCVASVKQARVINCAPDTDEESEANARLMAAAPELLAAAMDMLEESDCGSTACKRLVEAIKKARGK
jgi:hypothetical protein